MRTIPGSTVTTCALSAVLVLAGCGDGGTDTRPREEVYLEPATLDGAPDPPRAVPESPGLPDGGGPVPEAPDTSGSIFGSPTDVFDG